MHLRPNITHKIMNQKKTFKQGFLLTVVFNILMKELLILKDENNCNGYDTSGW
jgi:hypothetical protein